MAGQICSVTSGSVALVASTAKTILQIKAAANQRVKIKAIRLFGLSAAGGTDPQVKARLTRSTATFGTGTGVTPVKRNPSNGETVQTTAAKDFSVEPTTPTDSLMLWEFSPEGSLEEFYGPGDEIEIPGGQSAQLELTSTGTPNVAVTIDFEE